MNKEEFKKYLKDHEISFKEEKEKIIINGGNVDLPSKSLPEGIEFNNTGYVDLSSLELLRKGMKFNNTGNVHLPSLKSLPEGMEFNNTGNVDLYSLESLPEGMEFNNTGNVNLYSLESLPEGIEFNNGGDVHLRSLESLPEGMKFNNDGDVDLRKKQENENLNDALSEIKKIAENFLPAAGMQTILNIVEKGGKLGK